MTPRMAKIPVHFLGQPQAHPRVGVTRVEPRGGFQRGDRIDALRLLTCGQPKPYVRIACRQRHRAHHSL